MGFFSFLGRVLFASLFILSAWQMFNEFQDDGGPAAKRYKNKLIVLENSLSVNYGIKMPTLDIKKVAAGIIALKGIGGTLFVFGSQMGASFLLGYLLASTLIVHDFYNYNSTDPNHVALFNEFLKGVALIGALVFFLDMKKGNPRKRVKMERKTKQN